jgi:hypothetical protein
MSYDAGRATLHHGLCVTLHLTLSSALCSVRSFDVFRLTIIFSQGGSASTVTLKSEYSRQKHWKGALFGVYWHSKGFTLNHVGQCRTNVIQGHCAIVCSNSDTGSFLHLCWNQDDGQGKGLVEPLGKVHGKQAIETRHKESTHPGEGPGQASPRG